MTQIRFKSIALILCLISAGAYSQKQVKTYKENFKVNKNAALDVDTSHADIEFETWDKDEIMVEATIELDGVSDVEAKDYFKNGAIKILGNSEKVSISTGSENSWFFSQENGNSYSYSFNTGSDFDMTSKFYGDSDFESDSLFYSFDDMHDFSELLETPPTPPMPEAEFDYAAFKRDGKKYLEEWQKEFSKGFDKEYEKKLEEWGERMKARRNDREEQRSKMLERRTESREKLLKDREVLRKEMLERSDKNRAVFEARSNHMRAQRDSSNYFFLQNDSVTYGPNMFYFSTGGENKNYKVKKSIKVKLPKSVKIKMNVRHGEVKLAENTKNLNATLSYSSLLASTIDGDATIINASYSPVTVQNWNYGQLQTRYSDHVALKEVLNLRLSATSSDVVIDRLLKSAFIKNDLGPLKINAISKDFKELDISMQNAELDCTLPSSSYTIYVNGISSKLNAPASLTLTRTKNLNSFVHKGFHLSRNTDRSITINSKYSEVTLDE